MIINKLEHIFTEVSLRCFYPVFFEAALNKAELFEKIHAFTVIGKDVTVKLMKLQCFKAITGQAL